MLWFLMGYTSKLAGTETGVTEPKATFSRFFGQPFMPRNPDVYADMLGEKMEEHGVNAYLAEIAEAIEQEEPDSSSQANQAEKAQD